MRNCSILCAGPLSLGGRRRRRTSAHTPTRPATTRPAPDDDAGRDARRAVSATAARAAATRARRPRRRRFPVARPRWRRVDARRATTRAAARRARRPRRDGLFRVASRRARPVRGDRDDVERGGRRDGGAGGARRRRRRRLDTRRRVERADEAAGARTAARRFVATIAAAEEAGYEYEAFDGKAAKALRFDVPTSWVKAIDRAYDDSATTSGRTIAMIGNFKTIDTVSVRVETVSPEIAQMASSGEDAADAKSVADALTANERAAVEALESFGVIGGVENGRSGTMAFALMDDARVKKGPDGRKYYVFSYETEVCRAKIEEGMGGSKICVGPQGDVLDSIQRRSRVVVTFVGNRVVKLHASAVSSRFDEVEEIMNRAVDSFALNVV